MSKKIYIVLAVYFILGLLILKYYQYYIITDLVPYVDIAKKYLNGDFYYAINGIWGVLISWLLMPFLWIGIQPLLSFKILNLVIGALTIFGFDKLSTKFLIHKKIQLLLLYITIPIVLTFALVHTTPDLLVVCILLYYLNIIFDADYVNSPWSGVYAGFLGGLGYLAKHYVFIFIFVHLVLSHLFIFFSDVNQGVRKKIIRNFVVSYSIFLLISGFWIFAQSDKYGYFTIGTSPSYNRAWMAPNSLGHAPEYLGFLAPPNPTANSMWEDLSYYTDMMPNYGWSPIATWKNFIHQAKLVLQNLKETFFIFNKFSLLIGIIILFISIGTTLKFITKREIFSDKIFLSLVVVLLYSSGYLLIRTSDRYIWIVCFLLLLIGGVYMSTLYNYVSRLKNGVFFFGSILIIFSISFLVTPMRRFVININQDKNLYDLSTIFKEYRIYGNFASNLNWSNTSILSWYLDSKYLGMPPKDIENQELFEEFNKYNIDYFLVWNDGVEDPDLADTYPAAVVLEGLTVYKVK